jgi:hypothetical protein
MALYIDTKFSGLLHLALFFPFFAIVVWRHHRVRGAGLAFDLALGALLIAGLGLPKYVENALVAGNPLYPFTLRLFGLVFAGATEAQTHFGGYSGYSGAVFTAPMAIPYMFGSWFTLSPVLWPDVRTGGFGWAFPFVLLPATLAVTLIRTWRREPTHVLPLWYLGVMALAMPTPYWGRYTLPAALVAIVFTGWGWSALPRLKGAACWLLAAVCTANLAFAGAQLWRHRDSYSWPGHLAEALAKSGPERATVRIIDWLWPEPVALFRELLPAGSVVVYDQSADYYTEYFPQRLQARVQYLSSADPAAFVDGVWRLRARLVGVARGSAAEKALVTSGAVLLAPAGRAKTNLYRMGARRRDAPDSGMDGAP